MSRIKYLGNNLPESVVPVQKEKKKLGKGLAYLCTGVTHSSVFGNHYYLEVSGEAGIRTQASYTEA